MFASATLLGRSKRFACNPQMKTVSDIRRANLEALIQEYGTLEAVAAKGSTSSVYLSQIRNSAKDAKTGRPRQMGDKMARALERGCGKPPGWMDADHSGQPPVIYDPEAGSGMTLAAAIAYLGRRLQDVDAMDRRAVLEMLRVLETRPADAPRIGQVIERMMEAAKQSIA